MQGLSLVLLTTSVVAIDRLALIQWLEGIFDESDAPLAWDFSNSAAFAYQNLSEEQVACLEPLVRLEYDMFREVAEAASDWEPLDLQPLLNPVIQRRMFQWVEPLVLDYCDFPLKESRWFGYMMAVTLLSKLCTTHWPDWGDAVCNDALSRRNDGAYRYGYAIADY